MIPNETKLLENQHIPRSDRALFGSPYSLTASTKLSRTVAGVLSPDAFKYTTSLENPSMAPWVMIPQLKYHYRQVRSQSFASGEYNRTPSIAISTSNML